MRNLTPSTLATLPASIHRLADLEAAYNARRRTLNATTEAATLAGRTMARVEALTLVPGQWDTGSASAPCTMAWVDGPRTQPRGPNGRFLPRTWLADAELFLPADRAFFRRPLTASTES